MPSTILDRLPEPGSISNRPIRVAAEALRDAQAAHLKARRTVTNLEQTREAAEWRDAEAAEKARAAGKPEPKTRSHTAEHDRKADAAKHELKVCKLAEDRARENLAAAIDEHAEAWRAEASARLAEASKAWAEAVEKLLPIHAARESAREALWQLEDERPPVDRVPFSSRQLGPLEVAGGQIGVMAEVPTLDVLTGLLDLGRPQPDEDVPVEQHTHAAKAAT